MRQKRPLAIVAIALVALLAAGSSISAAEPARPANPPKVVVIVGPVGDSTARFMRLGEEAAQEAEKYTTNVVRLYTPNATWPKVKAALQGASIVVYLGHGNGWPSKYRDHLFPPTQNGLGLNPVAGGGNTAHQYFGEKYLASDIELAPNAAVILSHLCYASGNTEPGLPEGTIDQARQRIDNYAAGFLAAGAGAVIAEGHDGADGYIRELFRSKSTVEAIWRGAPTFHDNVSTFKSERSKGFVASMDPDRPESGFYRSLVTKPGLKATHVRGGGKVEAGSDESTIEVGPDSLASQGLAIESARLDGVPTADTVVDLRLRYIGMDRAALKGVGIGVRWDPLDVPEPVVAAAAETEDAAPPAADSESAEQAEGAEGTEAPPQVSTVPDRLVASETPGSVVAPEGARVGKQVIALETKMPAAPGLYRLVTTLHDADGIAYDAETQALIPALVVRVTGKSDVRYQVQASAVVEAGEELSLPFVVTNLGTARWGRNGRTVEDMPWENTPAERALVVGQWVGLLGSVSPTADAAFEESSGDGVDLPAKNDAMAVGSIRLPTVLRPGKAAEAELKLTAPAKPGQYLLLLDVVVPGKGSLSASGAEPALIRVDVR